VICQTQGGAAARHYTLSGSAKLQGITTRDRVAKSMAAGGDPKTVTAAEAAAPRWPFPPRPGRPRPYPVPGETQSTPHAIIGDHRAPREATGPGWWLLPGSYYKMLIARAITSAPMPRDTAASVIISSLAHRLIAEMSVGLNAVAVQKASDR
jgi:hypothetical protein